MTSDDFSTSQLCGPDHDLCMEGYPSSANSFLLNLLRRLRPELKIASHTHALANVKLAARHGVPWVLLMRQPVEAVASRVLRFDIDPARGFREWCAMYRSGIVEENPFRLVLFSELTTRTRETVDRLEEVTGVDLMEGWTEELEDEILDHIRDWAARHGREGNEGAPREERDKKRDCLVQEFKGLPEAREAERQYGRLVERRG